jgi:hypothetical protein
MESTRDPDELNALRRSLLALLPCLALADTARSQDPARIEPQHYRVALENDRLRVLEYRGGPGMGVCGEGMHSHPPHLTVALSSGQRRVRTPDGKVRVTEARLGNVFWSEAVTHEIENISDRDSHLLLVELKAPACKA